MHPEGLTAVGVSDLTALKERYPGVRFVQADGRSLPFATGEFDVVHCNAVVEHVGDGGDQARFIGELVRVARAGFVTTPNRWFPIESHTRLPLFHWLPRPAALAALRGLGQLERGQEWPVWLLSRAEFARLFPPSVETWVGSQRLLGVCATVSVAFWHWEESLSS